MKNAIRNSMTLILISLVACFMLITCANPVLAEEEVIGNGGGLITVTIGGESARTTVSWANALDSRQLTHNVTVSGGQGGPYTATIDQSGGGTAVFSVTPGQWTISVEARYSRDLVAVGEQTREIIKGDNGIIMIQMKEPNPSLPSYTVSFDSNGGSAVNSQTVKKYNKARSVTPSPKYEDQRFAGWYSNSGLTSRYDFNAAVTGNITLYAKWTE